LRKVIVLALAAELGETSTAWERGTMLVERGTLFLAHQASKNARDGAECGSRIQQLLLKIFAGSKPRYFKSKAMCPTN
jgi:hypothetical protein